MIDLQQLKEQLKLLGHNLPEDQIKDILQEMNIEYAGEGAQESATAAANVGEDTAAPRRAPTVSFQEPGNLGSNAAPANKDKAFVFGGKQAPANLFDVGQGRAGQRPASSSRPADVRSAAEADGDDLSHDFQRLNMHKTASTNSHARDVSVGQTARPRNASSIYSGNPKPWLEQNDSFDDVTRYDYDDEEQELYGKGHQPAALRQSATQVPCGKPRGQVPSSKPLLDQWLQQATRRRIEEEESDIMPELDSIGPDANEQVYTRDCSQPAATHPTGRPASATPKYNWQNNLRDTSPTNRSTLSIQVSTASIRSTSSTASKSGKKVDRVARYQQLQSSWSKDKFLTSSATGNRNTGRKPINFHAHFKSLHAAEAAQMQAKLKETRQKTKSDLAVGTAYVAPTSKRRDDLRWDVRMRMKETTETC